MASGSSLIRALDGNQVEVGALIRVVFNGMKQLSDDRQMKMFDVFVGEGSITPDRARTYMEAAAEAEEPG
jgi:hypothetical protein